MTMLGTLPSGWVRATIEDVLDRLEDGRTIHQGWSPQCEGESAGLSEWGVLKTTAIQPGAFDDRHNKRLPTDLQPRPTIEVQTGDILLTCAGPRSRCGVPCLVRRTRHKLMLSGKIYRFRTHPEVMNAAFLEGLLLSSHGQDAIDRMKTGGSDSGLNLTHARFREFPVIIAPLQEQNRIVDALESYQTRLEAAAGTLEQAQTKLDAYRASVLKAAVEGRLVATEAELAHAEGRDYESGETLLKRILAERRRKWEETELAKLSATGNRSKDDKWKAKYATPPAPDTSALPALPEGWCWTTLGMLKEFSLYGPRFSSDDYSEEGALVLRTSDISEDGHVNLKTPPRLKLTQAEFNKYKAVRGDLLITRTGSLGTLAVLNDDVVAIPGAYLIQYRLAGPLDVVWYCFHFLKSPVAQTALVGGGQGVGRPNLNAPTIEAVPIPFPPLLEQIRINDKIRESFSVIDRMSKDLRIAATRSSKLRQSILKWAFEGKLVDQDPHDESAHELLGRIRGERDARQLKAGRRRKTEAPK